MSKIPTLKYNVTFHGLKKWNVAMFEKMGWMLLAKRDGYDYKVSAYKKSVEHLQHAIEERIRVTECSERLLDLSILLKNVKTLKTFVGKL